MDMWLLILIGLFVPRFSIFLAWLILSPPVVVNLFVTILGFIFLPYTLLWAIAVNYWFSGNWEQVVPIVGLIFTIYLDLLSGASIKKLKENN